MTDKQQPSTAPERIWMSRYWANYTEHSCQFSYEQKHQDDIEFVARVRDEKQSAAPPERIWLIENNSPDIGEAEILWSAAPSESEDDTSIPYARVHPVDDARMAGILERQKLNLPVVDRLNPEYAEAVRDIDYLLSQLSSNEIKPDFAIDETFETTVDQYHGELWIDKEGCANFKWHIEGGDFTSAREALVAFINCLQQRLADETKCPHYQPVSSSERRCGECGHSNVGSSGLCLENLSGLKTVFKPCGCKCMFPATGAEFKAAALLCLEYEWGCPNYGSDPAEWCSNCQARTGATTERLVATTGAGEGEQRDE